MDREAELLTAGSTTGWGDWVHGELWLLPDGILRTRSGWAETFRHGLDTKRRAVATISDAELDRLATAPGNLLVRSDQIASASLRRGLFNGRLRLRLLDGRTIKLLWLRRDGVDDLLRPRLDAWLGSALHVG